MYVESKAWEVDTCRGHYNNVSCVLFHPRQDEWNDHFEWIPDFLEVLGRTPTGRATIQALQLNRDEVLRFRRVLIPAGEHPPD